MIFSKPKFFILHFKQIFLTFFILTDAVDYLMSKKSCQFLLTGWKWTRLFWHTVAGYYCSEPSWTVKGHMGSAMDGNSGIGAHVRSNLLFDLFMAFYKIRRSRKSDFCFSGDLFSFMHAQHFLSYHVLWAQLYNGIVCVQTLYQISKGTFYQTWPKTCIRKIKCCALFIA